jgi:hypothetical protein
LVRDKKVDPSPEILESPSLLKALDLPKDTMHSRIGGNAKKGTSAAALTPELQFLAGLDDICARLAQYGQHAVTIPDRASLVKECSLQPRESWRSYAAGN